MTTIYTFCFVTILMYLNSFSVRALLCAQCSHADPACRSGNILPTLCGGRERYCYIIHIYVDSAQGTYRGCTNTDTIDGCRPATVRQRGGTYCISVCNWEGCNSSHGNIISFINQNR